MSVKNDGITRREFITNGAVAVVGLAGGYAIRARTEYVRRTDDTYQTGRTVRFAHLSDIHLEPKNNAPEGLTAALRHVHALEDKPDMIITGGDQIMDCLYADDNWTTIQYDLFREIFDRECRLPVKHCIGNHDVWGWDKENSKTTGQEPLWGKKRALHEFGLANPYYSFDIGPWHFIMLDSTHPDDSVYTAKLDYEQFDWLQQQLESFKEQHICVISHIPILSACAYFDGENEKTGRWILPDEWMHADARKIKDLFLEHPNVRLCISGHIHLVDRVEYNGLTYICDGAVCGAWWQGNFYECDEGYGIFDLYDDGTFEHQYVSYGWEVIEEIPSDERTEAIQ